ncbi:MAG: zinc-binding dehydrogenase [Deltaproteobacteria bacterium]|nr:zinc-binding dehydrogenase [Deltaproteobacteria bacterium]MBI3390507.1 zinc-binding dehydrogenase [Deltaproteobacteria bacterium]
MKSRAQVLIAPGQFDLREVEVPEPGPGQVRMRVHACGICGSDKVLSQISVPGTILGHEVIAEVESCGAGVTEWRPGDRAIPIGDALGMSDQRGGFSEWITIAASALVRVPESVPSRDAVIGEPIGNGLHFVRRSRLQPGQRVAILGAGQIGLSILYWARRLGAGRIVVSEPAPARAQLARELGANAVINPSAERDLSAAIAAALGGRPEVVFEAVGRPDVMEDAIRLPGGRGSVVVLAGITMSELTIRPVSLCLKETDLVFPIGTVKEEVEEVVAALHSGALPAERFVSHRIRQHEIPDALHELGKPTNQIKVVVEYLG